MRKHICLILAFVLLISAMPMAAFAGSKIPINKKKFPDKVFRESIKKYDQNGDNKLTKKERDAVTLMEVGYYKNGKKTKAKSLKGIEYFTEVKNLECLINAVTSLDLSKNKKIETLNIQDNNLKKLNLSKNKQLRWVYCQDNKLTKLVLPKSKNLCLVECQHNKLKKLNLKGCSYMVEMLRDEETQKREENGTYSYWYHVFTRFLTTDKKTSVVY